MCASTGLRHGGSAIGIDGQPFVPLDGQAERLELAGWWESQQGNAKITGRNARNLNPIIRAAGTAAASTAADPTALDRELRFAWWWIWKNSSGPVKFSAFNSRSDRLLQSWSSEFQHRAIIPASWYVEKGVRFEHPTGGTFGIAAVTSTVQEADGSDLVTYSMVTRSAVGEAATVHDRMPLVIPPEMHDAWLDPAQPGDRDLALASVAWSEDLSHAMTAAGPALKAKSAKHTVRGSATRTPEAPHTLF
ncbi:SOS response-associated peptidase family protein [Leucobacter sp. cx-328]|uniref:SOS response-associated peptidase family protein n=1 Tax=unclassified Leucobacter TaxID=2621730 RepID=UPI00165DF679|nr:MULTISPECIES: SOS response-associated peptidase family protein [unclassified Leucobacter]MBC9943623.1 SOS response-associated peptidase family protein [Leucobacter sp. cx-328]